LRSTAQDKSTSVADNPPASSDPELTPQMKAWLALSNSDRAALAKNRQGDRLVVYYASTTANPQARKYAKEIAVKYTKEIAVEFNLLFEEWDVSTPEGRKKFCNRSASDSPEGRIKLMEGGAVYFGRAWLLPDGSLAFAGVQEYHPLVPVRDTAYIHVLATTDPPQGREVLTKMLTARRLARAAAEQAKANNTAGAPAVRTVVSAPSTPLASEKTVPRE
jgi:hypothetical protein